MDKSQDDLELRFILAREFAGSIRVEERQENTCVELYFSLTGKFSDAQRREEIIDAYRMALSEATPQLLDHSPTPLGVTPERQAEANHALEAVQQEALAHIRAVFEGTHRWSWRFGESPTEDDPEFSKKMPFSACRISLVINREAQTWSMMFVALLFDMRNMGPEDIVRPLDVDPPMSDQSDHGQP